MNTEAQSVNPKRGKLTDKIVRTLPVPDKGNRITYDTDVLGFGARVTAAGAIAFVLNYRRKSDGRERLRRSVNSLLGAWRQHGSVPRSLDALWIAAVTLWGRLQPNVVRQRSPIYAPGLRRSTSTSYVTAPNPITRALSVMTSCPSWAS